jgi:hypothetical protein
MRGVSEHPRLVIAEALAALCLVAVGFAGGVVLTGDRDDVRRATQIRLASAERAARDRGAELSAANARLAGTNALVSRGERRARALTHANARLRQQLRRAERSRRRARSRR